MPISIDPPSPAMTMMLGNSSLILPFLMSCLKATSTPEATAPSVRDLRVRPRYLPGATGIAGVGDVHTARRPEEDGVASGGLGDQTIGDSRSAAGARAVAGNVVLLLRRLLH